MLRNIFGKKESDSMAENAATIDAKSFKDALDRYPALIKSISKPPKEGQLGLEELDNFRYNGAPMAYSMKTGRTMESSDIAKLVEWKMRHGVFRPGFAGRVSANTDEDIAAATKDAFAHYAQKPSDISSVLDKISKPLKGIGPATASLLLAVHDPSNVIFFSDELYRWLLHDGKKVSPKYTAKEFDELFTEAKSFMSRVKCTPIELEKVAFVVIRESDPAPATKEKKAPSGLPRGRPKKPESEKKFRAPSGRGRGRPPKASTGEPKPEKGEPKKRGRKPKVAEVEAKAEDEANGEEQEEQEETTATPASKKRKASSTPASSAKRGAKKAKA